MDRRDILRFGLGSAVLSGCHAAEPTAVGPAGALASRGPADLDAFFRRLDGNMTSIREGNPFRDGLRHAGLGEPALDGARLRHAEDLTRKSLRSLLVTGSVGDLPIDERNHPAMVERLQQTVDEMDEATLGMTEFMEGLERPQRGMIQSRLRAQPDLGMTIIEAFDTQAGGIGVSLPRRTHLRTIAAQASWRLRAQPLGTFIEESSSKVRAVAANEYARTLEGIRSIDTTKLNTAPEQPSRGMNVVRVGAILLGVGALVGLAGAAITSGGALAGVFVITAGALLIVGGLITLLVGAAMRAAE